MELLHKTKAELVIVSAYSAWLAGQSRHIFYTWYLATGHLNSPKICAAVLQLKNWDVLRIFLNPIVTLRIVITEVPKDS